MGVRETRQRRWSAFLLLAVFVPMLVVSSLHVHRVSSSPLTECSACVSHQCTGHLGQYSGSAMHDCVLCQALSLVYVAVGAVVVMVIARVSRLHRAGYAVSPVLRVRGIVGLRAPPTVLVAF
ncbi:MAG: hypothetical protein IJV45_04370 [Prevotella sp.]|nr:hypothetical protein [Prevotella sp.]